MKKLLPAFAILSILLPLIACMQVMAQADGRIAFEPTARLDAEPLAEVSGMVKSRSYENTFWVVNDSGDEARLFAINREGENIIPTYSRFSYFGEEREQGKQQWQGFRVLYAENHDWESMTADDNYLYIGDIGNNLNNRRDLGIYMISEIDPSASTQSAVIKHMPIAYPEQRALPGGGEEGERTGMHYDSEALFAADGKLYLITKHRNRSGRAMERGANLYRLDTDHTERDNLLTRVDSNPGMLAVTGAELSPDGQTLAVISYEDLWLFDRPDTGDAWLSSTFRRYPLDTRVLDQVETVVWDDDDTLLLSNEQRDLFRVSVSALGAAP